MSVSWILFGAASLWLAWLCRHQLVNPRCHGFYRFFAFEGILWLALQALPLWFEDLASWQHWTAFSLLILSLLLLWMGVHELRARGGIGRARACEENFSFENTSRLVTTGIYAYVRHPMYSSLLLLSWALAIKAGLISGAVVGSLVTLIIFLTARVEERENRFFFGVAYSDYQKQSRMFFPFVW